MILAFGNQIHHTKRIEQSDWNSRKLFRIERFELLIWYQTIDIGFIDISYDALVNLSVVL